MQLIFALLVILNLFPPFVKLVEMLISIVNVLENVRLIMNFKYQSDMKIVKNETKQVWNVVD